MYIIVILIYHIVLTSVIEIAHIPNVPGITY